MVLNAELCRQSLPRHEMIVRLHGSHVFSIRASDDLCVLLVWETYHTSFTLSLHSSPTTRRTTNLDPSS